jgi:hypothetical protein
VGRLHEALDALALSSIEALALKGPALAEALYDDPTARPFTDLDLLVRKHERVPAVATLQALGYRHLGDRPLGWELAHGTTVTLVREDTDGVPIDLHWELIEWPRGLRPGRIETGEVLRRAVERRVGDRPALVPADEDLLIYLAVHWAVHHALAGDVWRRDLALLLERRGAALDWAAIVERGRRWRVRVALWLALDRIACGSNARVPREVLRRLRPRPGRRAALRRLVAGSEAGPARLEHLVALLLVDKARDRARVALASVVPSPGWARSRYGRASTLAAYGAHLARLLRIAGRTLRRG